MTAIFGGGVLVASACLLVHLLKEPVSITLHYRLSALIYVTQVIVVSGGMYWWGRGVLHSTQRWIAADRSLFAALLAFALGFGGVFYGLSHIVDTDKQYFLTDFFTILLDAGSGPKYAITPVPTASCSMAILVSAPPIEYGKCYLITLRRKALS